MKKNINLFLLFNIMRELFNKNKIKVLMIKILLIFTSIDLSGQSTMFDQMRKIPLSSPEAASLAKAVEFPVSYFNGRPDVSVPLYIIHSGDIELPISLSYNAGGVRVSEESSWVGLGWALNAGGVITHDIKGLDDDYNASILSFNAIFPKGGGNQYDQAAQPLSFTASANGLYKSSGEIYSTNDVFTRLSGSVDGEPDLYIYNFGKFSGKFVWLSSTEVVDISNNNIKFEKSGSSMIIATAPDGFKYEFGAVEMAVSQNGPTRNAYYLTKITSPANKAVTLNYKTFREYVYPVTGQNHSTDYIGIADAFVNSDYVRQMPSLSEEYIQYELIATGGGSVNMPANSGLSRNFMTSEIRNIYLDKISFEDGYVQFVHGSRKDLFGIKLDGLGIYRKDNVLVRNVNFLYDYFTGRDGFESYTTPGNGYKVPYDVSYRKKRLKLKGLTSSAEEYKFQYYEGMDGYTLPYKGSFAQDYWGYYNGAYGNSSLIPDFTRYNFLSTVPAILSNWVGANRDAKVETALEGTLKKIEYPTKGYTEFMYEMNEYSNGPTQQQVGYNTPVALNTGAGTTVTYVDITIDTYADIDVKLFCNRQADANPQGTGWDCSCIFPPSCSPGNLQNSMYAMIEKVDPQTNQPIFSPVEWQYDFGKDIIRNNQGIVYQPNVLFTTGRYKLTTNYPDNKVGEAGVRMAFLSLKIPVTSTSGGFGKGGGLRISSIRNYDPLSKQSIKKNYLYEDAYMMKFPKYYTYMSTIEGQGASSVHYATHTLYSSSIVPYSFSANGSLVGYAKITENYTGNALGRTEYLYMTKPDKYKILNVPQPDIDYLPGTPSTPFLDNGFLMFVNTYNKDNQLIKKISNTPKIELTKTYWAFKQRKVAASGWFDYNFPTFLQMSFYPIQAGKLLPGSVKEEVYSNNSVISSLKELEYSDKGYIKTETQTSSNGSILTKHYRYPTDFNSFAGWVTDLTSKNIINSPLEVVSKRDDKLIEGSFTTYKSHDNIITPDAVYQTETNVAINIPFIAPSGVMPAAYKQKGLLEFDANGNLSFSKATNNINIGYKWGYDRQYPIAECKNATNIEFIFEDFEGNGNIISNTTTAHTGKGGYNGTIALVNYFSPTLNGRSYRLSYFKIDGGGNWVNFEELYTGQSVSGSLDDIRIYPADGEIKTFTYEPLVGVTSSTSPSGITTYYKYDNFNRLANIRDQKGYIIKNYSYYYSPVLGLDNALTFSNVAITQVFTKQCTPGTGSDVPYTVISGKYTASTQEDANAMAQAEIDLYGQTSANQTGSCSLYTGPPVLISVLNGPGNDLIVNYAGPSGANYLYMFIANAATGELVNNQPFILSVTQTSLTATVTKGIIYNVWLTAGGQYYPNSLSSQTITINY